MFVLTQYPVLNPSQGAGNQKCQNYSLYILRRKMNEGQQCKSKNKSKNEIHKLKTEQENLFLASNWDWIMKTSWETS